MGSWVYLMIYSAPSLQVEHCLGWRLRRWTSNWIMYVTCMYVCMTHNWDKLTRVTNIRACIRKGLRLRPLEKQGERSGGGGSRSFCYVTFFGSPCVHVFFFFIISFLFLAYFFSAFPAASYYFTPFCFCLFVYFCMGLFCLGQEPITRSV